MEVDSLPKENGIEPVDTTETENKEVSKGKNVTDEESLPDSDKADTNEKVPKGKNVTVEESLPDSDKADTNEKVPKGKNVTDESLPDSDKADTNEKVPKGKNVTDEESLPDSDKADINEKITNQEDGQVEKNVEKLDETVTENSLKPVENGIEYEEISEKKGHLEPLTEESPQLEDNDEDDDDFNPLLLCPDISMDVEESPVLTAASAAAAEPEHIPPGNDMLDSNALFAPLFSTFVDEMTGAEISFNLTAEEQQLREKLYGPNNPIEYSKVHCTACNVHLGSALAGQNNRFVHPLLKVLICKECYHFYTSGEFEKDEDGSELYCRWCGQGGQVLCCTMCEFVFCKKCIRINFGRRKLAEVRDSDDWKCFRCDMSQLKTLRAMCVEFFEYVRRETARAASVSDPDFINRDLTNCCQTQAKKRQGEAENEVEKEVKKPKRRRNDEDPDYKPFVQEEEERPVSPVPSTSGINSNTNSTKSNPTITKLPVILPKATPVTNVITVPCTTPSTVRFGNSVLNVKCAKTMPQLTNSANVGVRSVNTCIRSPTAVVASRPRQIFTSRTPTMVPLNRPPVFNASPSSLTPIRPAPPKASTPTPPSPAMKHEWFEKTVRAAARVNSNLSYTLTQLNKAQANASSVEQLAVVHNKLQEILSSSINSLIQIRKNLRTEFIAGIKTIRFPPKKPVEPVDDDVILVTTTPNQKLISGLTQVTLSKKLSTKNVSNAVTTPVSTPSTTNTPTRGYLKVKSFSQLQKVPSECITIPDDDPPRKPKDDDIVMVTPEMEKDPLAVDALSEEDQTKFSESETTISANEDSNSNDKVTDKTKGPVANGNENTCSTKEQEGNRNKDEGTEVHSDKNDPKENAHNTSEKSLDPLKQNDNVDNQKEKSNEEQKDDDINEENGQPSNSNELCNGISNEENIRVKDEPDVESYNVKEKPSPKIRRMLSVKVNLKKTPTVESMVKMEPAENGGEK